jgi:hypothetical protein
MKKIESISELIKISEMLPSNDYVGGWFYRGQSDKNWAVEPKAFRTPYSEGDKFEFKFKMWLKQAHNYPELNYSNEYEAMAIAQHHGFATKLLDWSSNILIAAFFACCDNLKEDAKILAYHPLQYIFTDDDVLCPVEIERVVAYQPKAVTSRLKSQSGYFTYHKNKEYIIENEYFEIGRHETLHEWVIPADKKLSILLMLDRLSINHKTIFPDLDGLSKHHCLMDEIKDLNKRNKKSADKALKRN